MFHGFEMIGIGTATLLILDLFNRQSTKITLAFAIITIAFTAYYLLKILVISLRKNIKK